VLPTQLDFGTLAVERTYSLSITIRNAEVRHVRFNIAVKEKGRTVFRRDMMRDSCVCLTPQYDTGYLSGMHAIIEESMVLPQGHQPDTQGMTCCTVNYGDKNNAVFHTFSSLFH
jgi:hypothetical protein